MCSLLPLIAPCLSLPSLSQSPDLSISQSLSYQPVRRRPQPQPELPAHVRHLRPRRLRADCRFQSRHVLLLGGDVGGRGRRLDDGDVEVLFVFWRWRVGASGERRGSETAGGQREEEEKKRGARLVSFDVEFFLLLRPKHRSFRADVPGFSPFFWFRRVVLDVLEPQDTKGTASERALLSKQGEERREEALSRTNMACFEDTLLIVRPSSLAL